MALVTRVISVVMLLPTCSSLSYYGTCLFSVSLLSHGTAASQSCDQGEIFPKRNWQFDRYFEHDLHQSVPFRRGGTSSGW